MRAVMRTTSPKPVEAVIPALEAIGASAASAVVSSTEMSVGGVLPQEENPSLSEVILGGASGRILFENVRAAENPLELSFDYSAGEIIYSADYQYELRATYRGTGVAPREAPQRPVDVPLGAWMIDSYGGASDVHRRSALRQLRVVAVDDLKGNANGLDEDETATIGRYAQWMREGKTPPPIKVDQSLEEGGDLEVVDGNKIILAAKEAGVSHLRAWVRPAITGAYGSLEPLTYGNARFGFEAPPPKNPQLATQAFRKWFGNSEVSDEMGQPLVVFRGFRRVPKPDQFVTRLGRAATSFTSDPFAASVYAHDPETETMKPGGCVVPVFLSIQKPLDLRALGEQACLSEVFELLDYNFYKAYGEGDEVGYEEVADAIRTLDDTVYRSCAEYDIQASKPGDIFCLSDFSELADAISSVGEAEDDNSVAAIDSMLYDARIDLYALADNPEFVNLLVSKGYDGVVHLDPVNDAFLKLYREAGGDPDRLKDGGDMRRDMKVIETWRPIGSWMTSMLQIKSALGNSGGFDAENPNILM